jgi:signal transduction histidine kinase/PAS domain-containing protein
MKILRLLIIEDSEADARFLLCNLEKGGYTVQSERLETAADLQEALARQEWDLIISDYEMAHFSAPAALEILKKEGIYLPFIIVSGKIGEEKLVEAMRSGAHDYLMKGYLSRLVPAVNRELQEASERRSCRRAERAIRQGKLEWEAAFDSVSDIIILTDPKGMIIRCNGKLIEYFSTTYNSILGRNISELFYGNKDTRKNIFTPCAEKEDICFPLLPGWFNTVCYPMHPTESTHGFVHIITDVTRHRKLEEEKKISDRELLTLYAVASRLNSRRGSKRIMVDLLSQLHQMLQIDFSCIHLLERGTLSFTAGLGISREFTDALQAQNRQEGWIREVLEGKVVTSADKIGYFTGPLATSAEALGMVGGWCAVPLKIGSEVIGILFVALRSGCNYVEREVYLLTSIANQLAILIENHTLYNRMKGKNDELKRNKRELKEHLGKARQANIELGRLNTAKNLFIGMASHELKTPITSIKGGLQFLLQYSNLATTPEQKALMEAVYEGVNQLKGIVDDLLSLSRIEAQGFILKTRPINLSSICEDIRHTFVLPLAERALQVTNRTDSVFIDADEGFCRLVIRNLLENAIKFTPSGGQIRMAGNLINRGTLLAKKELLQRFYGNFPANVDGVDSFYCFHIADTGIGIPEEEQVRIFDKFYSVGDIANHSSGKSGYLSKGSGLGLSIVKGVMTAHGGMVWVEPGDKGTGSVFFVLFPLGTACALPFVGELVS